MMCSNGHQNDQTKQAIHQTDSFSGNENPTEFRSTNQNQIMYWILKHEWLHRRWRSIQELKHELVTFKLKKYAATSLSTNCVFIMITLIFILCSLGPHLVELSSQNKFYGFIIFVLALMLAITFAIIALHEQNMTGLRYKVPCVPFIPTLSIIFNVTMMTNLNRLTWIRFIVWLLVGIIIYVTYGIKNSTLNPESKRVKNDFNNRTWGSIDSENTILHNTAE